MAQDKVYQDHRYKHIHPEDGKKRYFNVHKIQKEAHILDIMKDPKINEGPYDDDTANNANYVNV